VKPEDLDWELLKKEVEVVLKSGEVLRSRVVSTSSYGLVELTEEEFWATLCFSLHYTC
jgi:small nuclear ribonucleoprotein (snRNP)-like protein